MNRSRMLQSLISVSVGADPAFIMLVKTDNAGTSANNEFTIPIGEGYIFDYSVDWGDGQSDTGVSSSITHTYGSAGTYTLKIQGIFPYIKFDNGGDKDKLIRIERWGDIEWKSFNRSFYGCSNLTSASSTSINTSNVTNMGAMFYQCSSLTSLDVSGFNTSNVTNMRTMFYDCSSLTSVDVSGFNTSNVTDMGFMFYNCSSLTSLDVSGFDTSNVTDMRYMFYKCSSLTSLDVSGFDTSNVTNMFVMFFRCSSLTNFDPSGFTITNVTKLGSFANNTNMGTTNYDNLLVNWEAQLVNDSLSPNFGNAQYTAGSTAATARQALITDHSWTITDGGAI